MARAKLTLVHIGITQSEYVLKIVETISKIVEKNELFHEI